MIIIIYRRIQKNASFVGSRDRPTGYKKQDRESPYRCYVHAETGQRGRQGATTTTGYRLTACQGRTWCVGPRWTTGFSGLFPRDVLRRLILNHNGGAMPRFIIFLRNTRARRRLTINSDVRKLTKNMSRKKGQQGILLYIAGVPK